MKKLMFFITAIAVFISAGAQSKTSNIPSNVLAAFSAKYPGAHLKKWKTTNGDFLAKFSDGEHTHTAWFDGSGVWLKTETPVNLLRRLPQTLRKNEIKAGFGPWYIETMTRVETASTDQYVLLVDKIYPWDPQNNDWNEHYYLTFNMNGQLVKKEKIHDQDE